MYANIIWGKQCIARSKFKVVGWWFFGKAEIVFPGGCSACHAMRLNAKIWPIARSFISHTDVAYITYGINILVPVA